MTSHPAVTDAAVIGVQINEEEVPRAYVVLLPNTKGSVSENDLAEFVKHKVSSHKRLRGGVVLVDAVPRSPAGKVLRKVLREMKAPGKMVQARL